jgi:hypothetical protein
MKCPLHFFCVAWLMNSGIDMDVVLSSCGFCIIDDYIVCWLVVWRAAILKGIVPRMGYMHLPVFFSKNVPSPHVRGDVA